MLDTANNDSVSKDVKIRQEAESIAIKLCSPDIFLGKNDTPMHIMQEVIDIFQNSEVEPMLSYLENKETITQFLKQIEESISFKERKGDAGAKNLISELRQMNALQTAFSSIFQLKTTILEIASSYRDAMLKIAQLTNMATPDLNSLLAKLRNNTKLRNDVLHNKDNNKRP